MLAAQNLTRAGRLSGVSASLIPGQIVAICGPNGAGKSSLLACLAGLLTPDVGAVTLDMVPMGSIPPQARAQAIGYLPQKDEVAWDVAVETLVGLGRIPWRGSPEADRMATTGALEAMHLVALRQRPISRLSGGELARAKLARVLAGQPRWLLADEPLAALDLAHQLALLGQFRKLADQGIGVVLVLHDLALAMNHADRVLVLDSGRLAADGAPRQALSEALISQVWGVTGRWLGTPGQQALAANVTATHAP
jgi:iron complex transport system ATP-binding protein